jgi:redox-sensing transcriptional repressor
MSAKILTKNQLARMPAYLLTIKKLKGKGLGFVNAQIIADDLNLNVEQVKKDLASVASTSGVPNKGREINSLIRDVESVLGYDDIHNAIIVGVGHLGSALLNYDGFEEYGLKIVGAFDTDSKKIGTKINGIRIYDVKTLKNVFKDYNAKIGIITVNRTSAQEVANIFVECGVLAIWNFAPINLVISDPKVILSNMNMATSLAVLSHQLYLKKEKNDKNRKSFESNE